MPKPYSIELHFQNYFNGQAVTIDVGGEEVAAFSATTRMQIGLAHIEKLQVADGDRITVRVAGVGEQTFGLVKGVTVYLVRVEDKVLTVEPARESPIYM